MFKTIRTLIKRNMFFLIVVLFHSLTAFGQVSPNPNALEDILFQAEKQTKIYEDTFKNLLAREVKTFEDYDKKGKLRGQLTVESNFIVYQSAKDENSVTEYRNVVKIDGKSVGDDKRTQDFFDKISKTTTAKQELDEIEAESSRYDKSLTFTGITLFQAPILNAQIRPFFSFRLLGKNVINGNEVFLISYQQTEQNPYILFNNNEREEKKVTLRFELNLPKSIKKPNALLRGKLWIDAKTFSVWREERELTIQPKDTKEPLPILQTNFEYQNGGLDALVPKQIVFRDFRVRDDDENLYTLPRTKVVLDYTNFSKPEVQIKSGEVNSDKLKKN
jgi:hypothetical protein